MIYEPFKNNDIAKRLSAERSKELRTETPFAE